MITLKDKILHEQIRLAYIQGPALVAGAILCAIAVGAFLWLFEYEVGLRYWVGALLLVSCIRLWVLNLFLKRDPNRLQYPRWGLLIAAMALVSGVVWGSWPLFFYHQHSTDVLYLISAIFAGMAGVTAASGFIFMPSFIGFSVALIMPMVCMHMFNDNPALRVAGVLLFAFLIVTILLSLRSHGEYRKLISMKFENADLLQHLEVEKRIAERAVVAKSRFLAAASHDMRQPLHATGLFLAALKHKSKQAEQLEIIDEISRSTDALNGLFNSLLDISKLDAEIIEWNPEHVRLQETTERLRDQFERPAKDKGLELKFSSGSADVVLFADVLLLERVLRNLIDNAIQYTQEGTVSVAWDAEADHYWAIKIEDTGIGIPHAKVEDVFSEYYQLDNPERDRNKGLGLGLAIVKRLCNLMQLTLQMESNPGEGTCFKILVPRGEMQLVDAYLVDAYVEQESSLQFAGLRVLVIDDELQVLRGMFQLLSSWGCDVTIAESANEALRVLAVNNSQPDIILTDYRLRDNKNGVDAVQAIREFVKGDIPALILSGDTGRERMRKLSASGLPILHKPVAEDELMIAMHSALAELTNGFLTSTGNQFVNG